MTSSGGPGGNGFRFPAPHQVRIAIRRIFLKLTYLPGDDNQPGRLESGVYLWPKDRFQLYRFACRGRGDFSPRGIFQGQPEFLKAAIDKFSGRAVWGGFAIIKPRLAVSVNGFAITLPASITPIDATQASFVAAVLKEEGLLTCESGKCGEIGLPADELEIPESETKAGFPRLSTCCVLQTHILALVLSRCPVIGKEAGKFRLNPYRHRH